MSAENECVSSINLDKCAAILLDVAGTTTSASFVKDTLLSFVISHAEEYLKSNWSEETIKESVKLLKEDEELDISKAVSTLKTLTEKNENNKGAKLLQGHIYKKGYEDGTLKAHVFSDVPAALKTWSKTQRVAIYSSGSVESQKLLFAHTTEGDISSYISQYFDLSVGSKTDSNSYKKIVKELSVTPEEVVFINDNVEEAKAAKEAGLIAVLIKREGNKEITEDEQKEFIIISSLPDLPLETTGKRKNEDVETPEAPPTKVAKTDPAQSTDVKPDHSEKNNINDEAMEVDSTNEIKNQDIKNDTEAKEETDVKADSKVTDSLSVALVDPKIYEKVGENTAVALEPMDQDVEISEEAKEISSDVTKSKLEPNVEESTNKDKSFEGKALSGTAPKCVADSTKDIETKPSVDASQENAVLTKQVENEPSKTELINSDKEGLNEKEILNETKLSEKKVEIIKSNADEVTTMEIKNTDITSELEKEQIKSQESKKETNLNKDNEEEKKCTKVENSQDKKKEETKSEEIEKKEIKTKETETKSNSSENIESEQNEAKEENMKAETNKDIKIDSMEKKIGCETSTTTNEIIKEERMETECKPNIDIQVDSLDTETKSKCEVSNTMANEILKTENGQTVCEPIQDVKIHSTETKNECETSDTRTNEIIKDDVCTKMEGSVNNIERNESQDEIKKECSAETKSNAVNVENISTSSTSITVKDSCSNENKSVSAENITNVKKDSDLKDIKLKETECNLKEPKECKLTESQEVKETSSGENKMETGELIKESAAEKDIEKISTSEDSSIDKEKVNRNDIKQSTSAEKENKCELSNGTSVENESDVNKNGDVEKNSEEEIKVKKLEEKPDSTPVSVEA